MKMHQHFCIVMWKMDQGRDLFQKFHNRPTFHVFSKLKSCQTEYFIGIFITITNFTSNQSLGCNLDYNSNWVTNKGVPLTFFFFFFENEVHVN